MTEITNEHEIAMRTDWTGDQNVINGTQSWVTYYCRVCGCEGDELDERPCIQQEVANG